MAVKRFWHWGTGIAMVYGVFAAATLGFAVFAMSQDVDLVSPEYYQASMAYDARQAAAERAMTLPFTAAIESDAAPGSRALVIAFPQTARPESGNVILYRASNTSADQSIPIETRNIDAEGGFRVLLPSLAPGPWTLQIAWTTAGQAYYREQRVIVP